MNSYWFSFSAELRFLIAKYKRTTNSSWKVSSFSLLKDYVEFWVNTYILMKLILRKPPGSNKMQWILRRVKLRKEHLIKMWIIATFLRKIGRQSIGSLVWNFSNYATKLLWFLGVKYSSSIILKRDKILISVWGVMRHMWLVTAEIVLLKKRLQLRDKTVSHIR